MAGGIVIPDLAKPKMIQGFYAPKHDGIPRGFYWDPNKGGEVRNGAMCSKNDSVAVGASSRPFALADEIDRTERRISTILERPIADGATLPANPAHASLYFNIANNTLMMHDGDQHIPIASAAGDEKRGPWCVGPCHICGVQTRSFREPTDTRPIYCGDCPNPHNVGGAKCVVEGCRVGIFESEVFCSSCIKDPVIWSSLLGGFGALYLAIRGATLVLSVPNNLQGFYLIGMLLIAVKAVRMILKGARGR